MTVSVVVPVLLTFHTLTTGAPWEFSVGFPSEIQVVISIECFVLIATCEGRVKVPYSKTQVARHR